MTLKEFQEKDLDLNLQIQDYHLRNNQCQAEIIQNEHEIIRLQAQRIQLQHKYAMEAQAL